VKHFVVYDASGNVLRYGICQDDMLDAQASLGEGVIEATLDFASLPNAKVDVATKILTIS